MREHGPRARYTVRGVEAVHQALDDARCRPERNQDGDHEQSGGALTAIAELFQNRPLRSGGQDVGKKKRDLLAHIIGADLDGQRRGGGDDREEREQSGVSDRFGEGEESIVGGSDERPAKQPGKLSQNAPHEVLWCHRTGRQANVKMRTAAVAFRPEIAAVIEKRLAGEREAEPQSVLAGGHKGLEQARANRFRNAGAGVAHLDVQTVAGGRGRDGNLSTGGHGFNRVRDEIQEHALHAGALEREFDRFIDRDANGHTVFSGGGREDIDRRANDLAQAAGFRRMDAAARHVNQLAQHFINHSRRTVDIAGQALKLVRTEIAVHHHFRAAVDRRERITEVMHDGAGKLPNGGNALTSDELFARALDGAGHRIERAGQTAEFVIAMHRHLRSIVFAADEGGGLIELTDGAEDTPREQDAHRQSRDDRGNPDEKQARFESVQVAADGIVVMKYEEVARGGAAEIAQRCAEGREFAVRHTKVLHGGTAPVLIRDGTSFGGVEGRGYGESAGEEDEFAAPRAVFQVARYVFIH